MITRFDHAVVAVRDLRAAMALYRDVLGFDVRPGGRHTGRGTENAIVRFGLDYLELLAVPDPAAEIAATGERGRVLVDYLARCEGGLVGYCLAVDAAAAEAERLCAAGLDVLGPARVERVRPDGAVLRWWLLWPGGVQWRRPWPFLIQAEQSDTERLTTEPPVKHPLGVTAIAGVSVAMRDRARASDLYGGQFGLLLVDEQPEPSLGAWRASYSVAGFAIDVLAPNGPGPLQNEIDALGEGPLAITMVTESLAAAQDRLAWRGVELAPADWPPDGWLIPSERAFGARLVLVECPPRTTDQGA